MTHPTISEERIEEIAQHYHDMTGDNDTVPWERCKGNYRTQVRKMVRKVLNCAALAALRAQAQGSEAVALPKSLVDTAYAAAEKALQGTSGDIGAGELERVVIAALTASRAAVAQDVSGARHSDDCAWNKTRLTLARKCTCGALAQDETP